jgi:hypothetical protein
VLSGHGHPTAHHLAPAVGAGLYAGAVREADESDIDQPGGQPDPWAGFLPGQDLLADLS